MDLDARLTALEQRVEKNEIELAAFQRICLSLLDASAQLNPEIIDTAVAYLNQAILLQEEAGDEALAAALRRHVDGLVSPYRR